MTDLINWSVVLTQVLMPLAATFVGAWAGTAIGAKLQKRWDQERSKLADVNLARAILAELVEQYNFLKVLKDQVIDELCKSLESQPPRAWTITLSDNRNQVDTKSLSFPVEFGMSSVILAISVQQNRFQTMIKQIEDRNRYINKLMFRYPDVDWPVNLTLRMQQANEQLVEAFNVAFDKGLEVVQWLNEEFSRLFPGSRFQRIDDSAHP